MALDRNAVLKKAQDLVLKGKLQAAVEEYERLLTESPKDENLLNTVGDLYSRLKNATEAIKYYKKLAEFYAERGFAVKAIAVYKRIVRMDPASIENSLRLADIQAQQGFSNEAKVLYASVAERCAEGGMKDKAIDILKKLMAIDPGAIAQRLQLAELYKNRARAAEAAQEYLEVGKRLFAKGSFDDAVKVLQKGLEADGAHAGILNALGDAYSEKGDFKSAVQLYEDLLKKSPQNAELLMSIGKVYFRAKDVAKAESYFQKAQQANPLRVDGFLLLADFHHNHGENDKALALYEKAVEILMAQNGDLAGAEHHVRVFAANESQNSKAFALLAKMYEKMGRRQDMLNARDGEAQAHITAGRLDEAKKTLEQLVAADPENPQYQTRLRFVQSKMGSPGAAHATPVAEAPQPSKAAAQQRLMTVDTAMENEDDHVQEVLTEADVFVKYGLIAKAVERLQNAKTQFPHNIEIPTKLLSIYNEQGNRSKAVEECVHLSKLFREMGDEQASQDILNDAREIDPQHPLLRHLTAPPAAVEMEEEEVEVDLDAEMDSEIEGFDEEAAVESTLDEKPLSLEESLEEVDFYISQGFAKEATDLLEKLRARFPEEPRILNKLRKLRPEAVVPARAPAAVAAAPKPAEAVADVMRELDALEQNVEEAPTPGEDFFDLASELEDDMLAGAVDAASEEPDMAQMFASFKKGVEAQVDAQDYDTHYDLGIAYKEMGLVDDAIAEFQVAAKNPNKSRYRDCCSMLGLCFLEKGMANIAAKWYRKGLEVEGLSDEDRMGLLYDLGTSLEMGGETAEAYKVFSEVYGLNSKYRDVTAKIKQLQAAVRS